MCLQNSGLGSTEGTSVHGGSAAGAAESRLLGSGRASLGAQSVKNLPAMQETQVPPLGWEDPLEEGMATHSSVLAWRIPWTEEPGGLQSVGSHELAAT